MKEPFIAGRDLKWSWQRESLLARIAGHQETIRAIATLAGIPLREKRRAEFIRPKLPPLAGGAP
jgi:membrane-bound lytic murein transglycosylase B